MVNFFSEIRVQELKKNEVYLLLAQKKVFLFESSKYLIKPKNFILPNKILIGT